VQFYSARLLFAFIVGDGRSRRRVLCDETVVLLRARTRDSAFRRALKLGRASETNYLNERQQKVRVALVSIEALDAIGTSIDGAEVASRLRDRSFARAISSRTRFLPELSVPTSSAPAGPILSARSRSARKNAG
jgi:hypothetical protein